MKALDTDRVRTLFPAFDLPANADNPGSSWAFFENAGGTFAARPVVERLHRFYSDCKVQPYGHSPMQKLAGEMMDEGRQAVASILNVAPQNLLLGPSTTQNFNTLATAFTSRLQPGDEVIVSEQDHEANIGAWVRATEISGASCHFWQVDPVSGELSIDDLEKLLNAKTRLVAVTHSSNIIGSINPLKQISALVHDAGAFLVADGVSYAPHGLPDITDLGVDAYCFSAYKTYATHLGIMYTTDEMAQTLAPQCHYFNIGKSTSNFDAAGPDHASIAAIGGLGEYFTQLHQLHDGDSSLSLADKARQCSSAMQTHEHQLLKPLLNLLEEKDVRIFGSKVCSDEREANVALTCGSITSTQLNKRLAEHQIAAGNGDFYAPRVLKRMGIENLNDGVLRLSFAHYNSIDDINQLCTALDEILPKA